MKIFKLDVDIYTFKYFPYTRKHMTDLEVIEMTDIQCLQMQFSSINDSTIEKFS
jgi:hypothetical protein